MSKKKKITTAIPRESLEPGWKAKTYKMNPSDLHIIETVAKKRHVSNKRVIADGLRLIAEQEGVK